MPEDTLPTARVAIYARVSSEEQREGQTIDSQIAELERFARAQGWIISGVYKDEGWSGAVLARPELDRLRDDASKGLFEVVLLNDVDRLARDVSHLGVIKRDLERRGIQVRFRKLPAEESPTANLMVNILGSFAEFEREMIADRTRRGRRHKVETRQQYLGSIAPYGYRYVTKDQAASKDGYLEIIPEQAAIVRQMFEWVDQDGLSARGLVRKLNESKALPRKGGQTWAKSSVLRILRCETYTGVWHYNKMESYEPPASQRQKYRRSLKCRLRVRPRSEWIPVQLSEELRLIERARWERVQAQLDRNRCFSPRNAQHFYLLRGLVECGGCHSRYVGDPNGGRFYYRCHRRCKKYGAVREELLNETVWQAVEEAVLNPALILEQIKKRESEAQLKATQAHSEREEIDRGLQKLEDEERRLLEAYRISVLTPAILGRELEQLNLRKSQLIERQAALNSAGQAARFSVMRQSVLSYCQDAAKWIRNFTEAERQRFLQLLITAIVYRGEEVVIRGCIPARDETHVERDENENDQKFTGHSMNDGIATMEPDSRGHNSVKQIPFEVAKSVSLRKPFWNAERIRLLRLLLKKRPKATLRELCAWMKQDQDLDVSITEMCRARIRLGFRHNRYQSRGKVGMPISLKTLDGFAFD